MKPPAGTFADFRLIKSRKVAQIIVEIPIELADLALAALGGLPQPDLSRWVVIAPLSTVSQHPPREPNEQKHRPTIKQDWPMASQIHMRCQEPTLWKFLQLHKDFAPLWREALIEQGEVALGSELAAEVVRQWCGVESRRSIVPGTNAAERWYTLEAEYEQWQRGPNSNGISLSA